MTDLQDDFQATVENIAQDARELERIEREKAGFDVADPRATSLSKRAEQIAEQLHRRTLAELDLTETAAAEG